MNAIPVFPLLAAALVVASPAALAADQKPAAAEVAAETNRVTIVSAEGGG